MSIGPLQPDRNSDRIVARIIFDYLTPGTKMRIQADGREAVEDLAVITNGYASAVRDELIKLIWEWKAY